MKAMYPYRQPRISSVQSVLRHGLEGVMLEADYIDQSKRADNGE